MMTDPPPLPCFAQQRRYFSALGPIHQNPIFVTFIIKLLPYFKAKLPMRNISAEIIAPREE